MCSMEAIDVYSPLTSNRNKTIIKEGVRINGTTTKSAKR